MKNFPRKTESFKLIAKPFHLSMLWPRHLARDFRRKGGEGRIH